MGLSWFGVATIDSFREASATSHAWPQNARSRAVVRDRRADLRGQRVLGFQRIPSRLPEPVLYTPRGPPLQWGQRRFS